MVFNETKIRLAIILLSLLIPVAAFGNGGGPPPDQIDVPKYTESPLINGDFTVSYGAFEENSGPTHYIIHVILEDDIPYTIRKNIENDSLNICDYQNLSMGKLIDKYGDIPKRYSVQDHFNLEGTPIISEIKLKGYNCQNNETAMLKGRLKIRVLPPEHFDRD